MISNPIILGSASPRRKELLSSIADGPIDIVVADIDETIDEDIPSEKVAEHLALKKAKHIFKQTIPDDTILITADTIVLLGDVILGKPKNKKEATQMLRLLADQTHQVITGVVIYFQGNFHSFSDITSVTFGLLTDSQIKYYVLKDNPLDKAGAYGIQDWIGKVGIVSIDGSYYNVMGLPTYKLYRKLNEILELV